MKSLATHITENIFTNLGITGVDNLKTFITNAPILLDETDKYTAANVVRDPENTSVIFGSEYKNWNTERTVLFDFNDYIDVLNRHDPNRLAIHLRVCNDFRIANKIKPSFAFNANLFDQSLIKLTIWELSDDIPDKKKGCVFNKQSDINKLLFNHRATLLFKAYRFKEDFRSGFNPVKNPDQYMKSWYVDLNRL